MKAVHKMADGHTYQQLAWELGIAKLPQGSGATGGARVSKKAKLSPEEQLEVQRKWAREDWQHNQRLLLFGYGLNFATLSDPEIEGQIAAMELAIAARQRWLKQPNGKRDAEDLQKWFNGQMGEVKQS